MQNVLENGMRLDTAQQKRLDSYSARLGTDRKDIFFDDRLMDAMKPFLRDEDSCQSTVDYLRTLKFSQANYDYAQIEVQLNRFTQPNHANFSWNKNYKSAKRELEKEFENYNLRQLQYLSDQDIAEAIPVKNTHAGYPFILTGKRLKSEYLEPGIQSIYKGVEQSAKEKKTFDNTILIAARTQASGAFDHEGKFTHTFKEKSRMVSMVGLPLILAECKFARPLQHAIGVTNWYAGGKDTDGISSIISDSRSNYNYYVSIDYSHYDQSISDWLIRDAFDIMECSFRHDRDFDKALFDVVREDMIIKHFIDAKGQVVESRKGVGSGSMFTQLVDSIVNRLMVMTYAIAKNHNIHCIIMGDDNLIYSREKIDLQDLCSYISHNFGVTANSQKCSFGTSKEYPEFLSRTWTADGVWREPNILISKLLYPEKFRKYIGGANPNLIIYAYILTFPLGMREFLDTEKFMNTYSSKLTKWVDETSLDLLSGLMRYNLLYLNNTVLR